MNIILSKFTHELSCNRGSVSLIKVKGASLNTAPPGFVPIDPMTIPDLSFVALGFEFEFEFLDTLAFLGRGS